MAVTTFAAIDISSYEITMKIFEFSRKGWFPDRGRYPVSPESWSREYILAEPWKWTR